MEALCQGEARAHSRSGGVIIHALSAIITKEGKITLATFPNRPGCQTKADLGGDVSIQAADSLRGWLEPHLLLGRVPPRPSTRKKGKVLWVEVPAALAVELLIRWARNDAGQGPGTTCKMRRSLSR